MRMRKKLLIVFIILIFLGILTWKLLGLAERECFLCIKFKHQNLCDSAFGPTDEQAIDEAHRSLCARLAAGVTEVVACQRVAREEVACKAAQR